MNENNPSSSLLSRYPVRMHDRDVGTTKLKILAPADPDSLLDDPIVEDRYRADNYLPYWPIIWPSAMMIAAHILHENSLAPTPRQGAVAMDLGCGLGIAGIAAGLKGWCVEFTDYDPEAVQFAAFNARGNGIPAERFAAYQMDWRQTVQKQFDWLIAS